VGKSVLLKDTIAALCRRRDVDPRQVIYLATDTMKAADLNRVAALGRDLTRSIDPAPRIWLLDEITFIRDWTGPFLRRLRSHRGICRTLVSLPFSIRPNSSRSSSTLLGRAT
jgi:predicted AAA+ superfamily ATPase